MARLEELLERKQRAQAETQLANMRQQEAQIDRIQRAIEANAQQQPNVTHNTYVNQAGDNELTHAMLQELGRLVTDIHQRPTTVNQIYHDARTAHVGARTANVDARSANVVDARAVQQIVARQVQHNVQQNIDARQVNQLAIGQLIQNASTKPHAKQRCSYQSSCDAADEVAIDKRVTQSSTQRPAGGDIWRKQAGQQP